MGADRVHPDYINPTFRQAVRTAVVVNVDVNAAPDANDGLSLALADELILSAQTDQTENGPYVIATLGTGANGVWTRRDDGDADGKLFPFNVWPVMEGDTYAGKLFYCTNTTAITVDTTNITIAELQIGGAGGTGGSTAGYTYDDTTAEADPGTATVRLNNATLSSATEIYLDNENLEGASLADILSGWKDGRLTIAKTASPLADFELYEVLGAEPESGYVKLHIAHIAGEGTIADGDGVLVTYDHADEEEGDNALVVFDDFDAHDDQAALSRQWRRTNVAGNGAQIDTGHAKTAATAGTPDSTVQVMSRQRVLTFDITIELKGDREDYEKAEFAIIALADRNGADVGAHYLLRWPMTASGAADPKLYVVDTDGTETLLSTIANQTFDDTSRKTTWQIECLANGDTLHTFLLDDVANTTYTHSSPNGLSKEGFCGWSADVDYGVTYGDNHVQLDYFQAFSTGFKALAGSW